MKCLMLLPNQEKSPCQGIKRSCFHQQLCYGISEEAKPNFFLTVTTKRVDNSPLTQRL